MSLNYALSASAATAVADHLLGLLAFDAAAAAPPPAHGAPPPPPPVAAPSLRLLSLVGCPLDGVVARRLARALLHAHGLVVLRLGGGGPAEGVGPMGSRALAEAIGGLRGLVVLEAAGLGLTDNAAQVGARGGAGRGW